jgi:hypothetical protein
MPAGRKGSMAIGLELAGSIHDAVRALKAKGRSTRVKPDRWSAFGIPMATCCTWQPLKARPTSSGW